MAKADAGPIPMATEAKPLPSIPTEQVPELFGLVALLGLIMSGVRSEKPMGRQEHDEWLADRAWGLARAFQVRRPK